MKYNFDRKLSFVNDFKRYMFLGSGSGSCNLYIVDKYVNFIYGR